MELYKSINISDKTLEKIFFSGNFEVLTVLIKNRGVLGEKSKSKLIKLIMFDLPHVHWDLFEWCVIENVIDLSFIQPSSHFHDVVAAGGLYIYKFMVKNNLHVTLQNLNDYLDAASQDFIDVEWLEFLINAPTDISTVDVSILLYILETTENKWVAERILVFLKNSGEFVDEYLVKKVSNMKSLNPKNRQNIKC